MPLSLNLRSLNRLNRLAISWRVLAPKKRTESARFTGFCIKKNSKHAKNRRKAKPLLRTLCVDETHTKLIGHFLFAIRSVSVRPRRAECMRHFRLFVAEDVLYRFRENNIRRVHEDDVVARMLRFVFDFVEYELFLCHGSKI